MVSALRETVYLLLVLSVTLLTYNMVAPAPHRTVEVDQERIGDDPNEWQGLKPPPAPARTAPAALATTEMLSEASTGVEGDGDISRIVTTSTTSTTPPSSLDRANGDGIGDGDAEGSVVVAGAEDVHDKFRRQVYEHMCAVCVLFIAFKGFQLFVLKEM